MDSVNFDIQCGTSMRSMAEDDNFFKGLEKIDQQHTEINSDNNINKILN